LRDDDLTLLQELVGGVDSFIEQTAGIATKIQYEAVDVAELVERVTYLVAGGLDEA
jgi:hypothetical protein